MFWVRRRWTNDTIWAQSLWKSRRGILSCDRLIWFVLSFRIYTLFRDWNSFLILPLYDWRRCCMDRSWGDFRFRNRYSLEFPCKHRNCRILILCWFYQCAYWCKHRGHNSNSHSIHSSTQYMHSSHFRSICENSKRGCDWSQSLKRWHFIQIQQTLYEAFKFKPHVFNSFACRVYIWWG